MSRLTPDHFVYSIDTQADLSWYPTPPGCTIFSVFMATKTHAEKRGCLSDQPDPRPGKFFPKEWRANQQETNQWYIRFPGTQMELIAQLDEIGFSTNLEFDKFLEGISSRSEEYQAYRQRNTLNDQLQNTETSTLTKKSKM